MTSTATGQLTRAEQAYAHLASFAEGDVVDVDGMQVHYPATVVTPLRADGDDLASAYLVVCGDDETDTRITVASLLDGRRAVTSR